MMPRAEEREITLRSFLEGAVAYADSPKILPRYNLKMLEKVLLNSVNGAVEFLVRLWVGTGLCWSWEQPWVFAAPGG